jgi:hypothetical protein
LIEKKGFLTTFGSVVYPYRIFDQTKTNTTMKTKSLYLAALIVLAGVVSAVGKDEPRNAGLAVVPVKGSEVFRVIYKGESASKVKLYVYNSSSRVIFSETVNSNGGFIRPLNFSGLQFGEYTIEVTDASGKKSEKVNYQPAKSENTVHVSKLSEANGKFLLSVAQNHGETYTVRIFDAANNLIFTDIKTEAADFAKLYNLKNVVGAVTFEVSNSTGVIKTITF